MLVLKCFFTGSRRIKEKGPILFENFSLFHILGYQTILKKEISRKISIFWNFNKNCKDVDDHKFLQID